MRDDKRLLRHLRRARTARRAHPQAPGPAVSPLAPKDGFPAIPPIAGVRLATAAAGVRYRGRTDVMLAAFDAGTTMAGVFTRSSTRAAPVLDCEAKIATDGDGGAAILINSGNANAFTGSVGMESVTAVTGAVAAALEISPARVFTASTGVIGERMAHDRITGALAGLTGALAPGGFDAAARAIMTTDTFPKGAWQKAEIGGRDVTVAGIAKGSGMIAPDMATMLVCLFTDARIARPALQAMLSDLTGPTFNAITVDSDTSTSDSLFLAATGAAGNPEIADPAAPEAAGFRAALRAVMQDLALQVVRDGEGATKLLEVRITGAADDTDARKVAMAIANSPLVKTAVAGEDPNWGRVVMAVGKSGARADRDRLRIMLGGILLAENGAVAASYAEAEAAAYMKNDDLVLTVDLGLGSGASTVWTCDLTQRYITINADYRS